MKSLKALLLILDQWGLHEIKIHKYLKTLLVILDQWGSHEIEIHQKKCIKSRCLVCDHEGLHEMPEVPALESRVPGFFPLFFSRFTEFLW